jgi:hypothetical protein
MMEMATATQNRVSGKEIEARAKMAGFIDRVINTIQSTPKKETPQKYAKASRHAKRPAR